ncbi:hypothetical protein GCK72_015510 [Caenorhabditis remanei]|uniref:Uncharacterized protein n=1 Tax=Caenorhabditis remanei TaxID=31234 RepID=A0A6A5GU96_CAERE|nr:hypothetical protein GCK72_015510 [Caenorhabditis remanei]KAF1759050.1 hypothetical protein GCK72_015510 [Caenorhabditis remanei]
MNDCTVPTLHQRTDPVRDNGCHRAPLPQHPRTINPDTTPTFFRQMQPNSSHISQLENIRDKLLEIEDGMDWLREPDACSILEKIRKKIESVMTWEKFWELIIERQIHCMEDIRTNRNRHRDALDKHLVRTNQ